MYKLVDKNDFYQWDLERKLEIIDEFVTEVHFKKYTSNELLVCEVYTDDDIRIVDVPNILFTTTEKFIAYFYCNDLYTKQHANFEIVPRPKPTDYVYTETEVKRYDTLEDKIEELEIKIDNIPKCEVDQEYNSESENAQSGKAVKQAIAEMIDTAPETLDTLNELANALGNDPNFATTVMTEIGKKANKDEMIGKKTEEGGVIIGDDDNNKALAKDTFVNGNDNWAGYYGYKISYIAKSPGNDEIEIWLDDENLTTKVKDAYAINDIVQMHLQSHYHDKYYIFQIINDRTPGNKAAIILKPTYGDIITDTFTLVPAENDPEGLRNWLYVIGKPYGEPMKYSKGAATFGNHNTVTGQGALVAGNYNEVPGHAALAAGSENKVGYCGFASGVGNQPIHNRSAAMGYGLKSGRANQVLAGMYNEVEEDAMFVVGGGDGDAKSLRKTVFKVDKNGNTAIKRDLSVGGEIKYKDVNLTEKLQDVDYQLNAPDRYKIVTELPDPEEVTNYSDMYLIAEEDDYGPYKAYTKYIYNDAGDNKYVEQSNVWTGNLEKPSKNNKGQYVIDSPETLAYAIYYGGTVDEETGCHFVITKDIYVNDISAVNWATGVKKTGYSPIKWYSNSTESGQLVHNDFNGTIDGGYHTIYGLFYEYKWSYSLSTTAAGLIPSTTKNSNVVVRNLNIDNSFIRNRGYSGGIVGKSGGDLIIENCSIGANTYIGGYYTGMVRGASREGSTTKIVNCYSLGNVVATNSGVLPEYVGISGYYWENNVEITSCFSVNSPISNHTYENLRVKDCYCTNNEIELEGVKVLKIENMKGLDALTNPNKMPLLDKLHMFKATEGYPVFKFASFDWIKIDDACNRFYVDMQVGPALAGVARLENTTTNLQDQINKLQTSVDDVLDSILSLQQSYIGGDV